MYIKEDFIKSLADKYGRKRENLMPILQEYVEKERYLSDDAMVEVARQLDISAADVFGTASFYSFLNTKERGKYIIRICKTISCSMKGKNEILSALEDTLKIKVGQTSSDKKFSLVEANCIGWCHKAPAMLINDIPYTELTPQKAIEIVEEYMRK